MIHDPTLAKIGHPREIHVCNRLIPGLMNSKPKRIEPKLEITFSLGLNRTSRELISPGISMRKVFGIHEGRHLDAYLITYADCTSIWDHADDSWVLAKLNEYDTHECR